MKLTQAITSPAFPALVEYLKQEQAHADAGGFSNYTPLEEDDLVGVLRREISGGVTQNLHHIAEMLDLYFSKERSSFKIATIPSLIAETKPNCIFEFYAFERSAYFRHRWFQNNACTLTVVCFTYAKHQKQIPASLQSSLLKAITTGGDDLPILQTLGCTNLLGLSWIDKRFRNDIAKSLIDHVRRLSPAHPLKEQLENIDLHERPESACALFDVIIQNKDIYNLVLQGAFKNTDIYLIAAASQDKQLQQASLHALRSLVPANESDLPPTNRTVRQILQICPELILKDNPELTAVTPSTKNAAEVLLTRALGFEQAALRVTSAARFTALQQVFQTRSENELLSFTPKSFQRSKVRQQASGMSF